VAARPALAQPAHLRLRVGPITWQVCDQTAWHSLGAGLDQAGPLARRCTATGTNLAAMRWRS
jgi:hypothetical protein